MLADVVVAMLRFIYLYILAVDITIPLWKDSQYKLVVESTAVFFFFLL